MLWGGALALLCFATQAFAQGSAGGSQASCSAAQSFVYQGCYDDTNNGAHVGFTFQLSSNTSSEKYYPGFTGNVTVDICKLACRGHGWKLAAPYSGTECFCGAEFPSPNPPSSGSTSGGVGSPSGSNPGTRTSESQCNSPCAGNSSQICGGSIATSLYFDPSFTNDTAVDGDPSNYNYLGCYNNVNPGPMYVSIETTSTFACVKYCAALGYPYSARSGFDSQTTSNTCGCGTEIQSGLQIPENSCAYYCNGSATAQ